MGSVGRACVSAAGRIAQVPGRATPLAAFTRAVVKEIGLGKADLLDDGFITTSCLDTSVEHLVRQFIDKQQISVMERPARGAAFRPRRVEMEARPNDVMDHRRGRACSVRS
jgi:hypothetical protein